MNSYLVSDKPIIYADMNVFRYLAHGNISIRNPERFKWVYSHVHLDEIVRNGNKDALEGMKLLNAIEITDILDNNFQSVGNIVLRDYKDPFQRYDEHVETIGNSTDSIDFITEFLIRICGADNFKELSKTPQQLREAIDKLTEIIPDSRKNELRERATDISSLMKDSIDEHLSKKVPIDKTRRSYGITSEDRKKVEKSNNAIDDIWELISPALGDATKNKFFGFEPIPGLQHTQMSAISGAYIVLNLIGISPDKGLSKRDKIKNIMSDGQHAGMASYCNALLSADRGIINKATCIYSYLNSVTNALHFEYREGLNLELGISKT